MNCPWCGANVMDGVSVCTCCGGKIDAADIDAADIEINYLVDNQQTVNKKSGKAQHEGVKHLIGLPLLVFVVT